MLGEEWRKTAAGFTMVELVVVIIVTTIVAAVAVPRFMGRTGFDLRGFSDQAQGVVRYAQKTAVGKRRLVFVEITAARVRVCYDDPPDESTACAGPVIDPVSGNALSAAAPSGVTLAPAAKFSFNGLGAPSLAASLAVTVSATGETDRTFTIQRETGYVSAP